MPTPQLQQAPGQYGMTMLFYSGDERTFRGSTGTKYRFGGKRLAGYVDDRDVDVLFTEGAFALTQNLGLSDSGLSTYG